MKKLNWQYDKTTEYWAKKQTVPIKSRQPKPQYDGLDYRMREETWKKHILNDNFPEYCHYPQHQDSLLGSPTNIIKCFQDHKMLEGLALTIAWGSLTRTKTNLYQKSLQKIERTLLKCLKLTEENNSVEGAWNLLVNELNWGYVATSKCLHFLARSLGYETNPPIPIDNKVFIDEVWPTFKKMIDKSEDSNKNPMPKNWWDYSSSWNAYNRYMTAMNCWSIAKGWTTTQLENTLFVEYYPNT
jgi:hypothetical protein